MESQTIFNVVFVLVTLILIIMFVRAKPTNEALKKYKSTETIMSEDNYRGELDETDETAAEYRSENVEIFASQHNEDVSTEPDLLLHHDAANLPIPQFIRLANGYQADLLSASNVVIEKLKRSSETFCVDRPVPNAYSSFKDPYFDNAHPQWSSRMSELWDINTYVAAKKSKFRATSDAVCYRSYEPHHSRMYVVRLLRIADKVEFNYVHFTQTFKNSYTDDRSYTALVEALNTLKHFHSDADYVIVGNFNVHGHEAVFKHHLPDHYAVCDFRKVPTNMDVRGRGLASPDGLVVSTRVYQAIEYNTDMSGMNATNGALLLLAALFVKHPNRSKGAYISDFWPLRNMMNDMAADLAEEAELLTDAVITGRNRIYYDKGSSFDPSRHCTDTVMDALDLRATATVYNGEEKPDTVEAVSSNVLFRTEPPVTVGKYVGNGIVIQPQPPVNKAPTVATEKVKQQKKNQSSKAKKVKDVSVKAITTQQKPTSPYSDVIRDLNDLETP